MQRYLWLRVILTSTLAVMGALLFMPLEGLMTYGGIALQSVIALMLAFVLRLPWWWRLIVPLFFPLAYVTLSLEVPPYWFLIGFAVLWFVFGGVAKQRVPLFLSNEATLASLETQLPENGRFLDLGAGTGTVLAWLHRFRPDLRLTGVEHALLPWFCGWLRLRQTQVNWVRADFSAVNLSDFDVIYTFLSPAAMPYVWKRFQAEARADSLLISNAFVVENVPPISTVVTGTRSRDRLYIWRKS